MSQFNGPWTNKVPVGVDLQQLGQLLATKPVRFIVGQERAEFHLHGGLVACLSAPLHALAHLAPVANLSDTSTEVFSHFAQFVYSGHYDVNQGAGSHGAGSHTGPRRNILLQHAQLWAFAQMYHVESLKRAVQMQLTNKLTISQMSPVTFIAEFGELVRYVYGACLRLELRQIVSQFAATVAAELYHLSGWHDLLSRCPGFAWDTLNAMLQLEDF